MRIFTRVQIHYVETPHEIEYPPPAGANSRNFSRIPIDVEMSAVEQRNLPHWKGGAKVLRGGGGGKRPNL